MTAEERDFWAVAGSGHTDYSITSLLVRKRELVVSRVKEEESLVYFVLFIFYTFSHPYSTAHFDILEVNGEDVTGRVCTKVTGPHSNTRRLPLVSSTRREVVVGAFHTSNAPV